MIKLISLSFEGIGRFTKKQTVDFSDRDKLVQVDGKNENTGGSSGAGKSTLFHSLDYLLGLNDIPTTGLQSRNGKASLWAEGVFEIDDKKVTVTRSKKDGLSIVSEDESISGNVKLAEERLDQLIGVPKKLFKKMIHKKQKEGGFFLNLTAKESFEFLIKVLGLESWTAKIEKIEEDIKSKQKRLGELKTIITNKYDTRTSLQSMLELKKKPEAPEYTDEQYETLRQKKDLLAPAIKDLRDMLEGKMREIPIPSATSVFVDDTNLKSIRAKVLETQNKIKESQYSHNARLSQLRSEISSIKESISKSEYAEKELLNIVQKVQKLKEQQKHIESESCPTCSQSWKGKDAQDKVRQISDEIGLLSEKAWECKQLSDSKAGLIQQHEIVTQSLKLESDYNPAYELDLQLDQFRKEAAVEEGNIASALLSAETKTKLDNAEYGNQVQKVRSEYTDKINIATTEYNRIESEMNLIGQALRNHKNLVLAYELEMKGIKEKIREVDLSSVELVEEEARLAKQILVAEESKKVIKAYTLQIFQESLDYIGEQASQILSNVPNMSNSTIYFESCKETKSGSIKDEVNPIINMDGENEISIKTLSGGERTSIDLAVDLALIEMIETKAGKGADFFILDEPFDGLDSVNKTECLDILQNLDTNKKIIIVDHSAELKALVHDIIMVVRQGEDSFVV